MNLRTLGSLVSAFAFVWACDKAVSAQTVAMGRSPILSATLPINSTYQVESSTNGTSWNATGVLIAGTGTLTSTRLDGFPAERSYRLAAVNTTNVVSPTVSYGVHLQADISGSSEIRFESRTQLTAGGWTNQAFAFYNLHTGFVSPLPPPLLNQAFFRALQPTNPLAPATISYYTPDTNNVAAGYGMVANDMPQVYRDGHIAAPCPAVYNRGGSPSAAAGECYELVGPQGKTVVIIADTMVDPPSRTCEIGQPYFDIGERAFTNLFSEGEGFGTATYRLVPAPVIGNVKMVCPVSAGGYYIELRPYNHRAGVIKMEVQGAGGGPWIELPRTDYNSFVYNTGTPLEFPFLTRVTSRFGEEVTFPPIDSPQLGDRFVANGQFNVFPDQGPTPVWILPPIYTDAFTNVRGGDWGASGYGGTTLNPSYSGDVYRGTYSLRISDVGSFAGATFSAPVKFPPQTNSFLEFAIRSEGAAITSLKVQFGGVDSSGVSADSVAVSLPPVNNNWQLLRIPLKPAMVPAQISVVRLMNSTSATLPAINMDAVTIRW